MSIDWNAVLCGIAGGFIGSVVFAVTNAMTKPTPSPPTEAAYRASLASPTPSSVPLSPSPPSPPPKPLPPEPGSVWTFDMEGYSYYAHVFEVAERKGFTLVHYSVRREDDPNIPTRAAGSTTVERFLSTYKPARVPEATPAPTTSELLS